jgi:hypothetical protein
MKVKYTLDLKGHDIHIENVVDIDEQKLVELRGFSPKNYIYSKALCWAESISNVDYEILEGEYGTDLPYFDEPYSINK